MASSLNIAAFNLGNALGAWLGGASIAHGLSLGSLPWVAAALSAIGLAVAACSIRLEQGSLAASLGEVPCHAA